MSSVEFQEDGGVRRSYSSDRGIIGYLIRNGWVRNKKNAETMLLVISLVCVLVAGYFLTRASNPGASYGNYEQILREHPEYFDQHG